MYDWLNEKHWFAQQGWQCPVCGRIYSPMTFMCYYCSNGVVETTTKITLGKKDSDKEEPWYYNLGESIEMKDAAGVWHKGFISPDYRFKDGIVTMTRDDGLGKIWCSESREGDQFRRLKDEE